LEVSTKDSSEVERSKGVGTLDSGGSFVSVLDSPLAKVEVLANEIEDHLV